MHRPSAIQSRWPTGILAALVVGAPLALGAVHLPSRLIVAWAALVAMAWAMVYAAQRRHRAGWGLLGAGLIVAVAAGLAQWIPLPAGLVGVLSEASRHARVATAEALAATPAAWHPLSLDGPRTAAMWVQLVGMLALFLAAFHVSQGRTGRRVLPVAIEVAGLAVFAVGAVQTALGADRIYGVYMPSPGVIRDFFPTSFVNSNHAAALMLLSATVAAGRWLSPGSAGRERRFHQAVWLLTLTGVILSASRANIALAFPALGLLALLARSERSRETVTVGDAPRFPVLRPALATLAVAVVLLVVAGPDRWFEQVAMGSHSLRVALDEVVGARWEIGAAVVGEAPWSGVGLGAFAAASPGVTGDWARGYVDHAHNAVLQVTAAFGVPLGLLVIGLVSAGFLAAAWRVRRDLGAAAMAVGLGALAVQNLVDFSLMVPGVGAAAAVGAGWLVAVARTERRSRGAAPPRRFHLALGAAVVAGMTILVGLASARALTDGHGAWEERVRTAMTEGAPERVDLADMLHEHPADYRLVLLSSIVASAEGAPERGLALAGRARELAPREPMVILQHARAALAADRDADALVHLASLAAARPSGLRLATREVLRLGTDRALVEAYFSRDPEFVLEAVRELRRRGHAESVARLAEWGLEHHPASLALREVLAELWMRDPARADDIDDLSVDTLALGAQDLDQERGRALKRLGYLLQGYALQRDGRSEEAWHMFEEAAQLEPARSARPLAEAARILIARGGRAKRLERTLDALEAVTEHDDRQRAVYHHLRAMVAERRADRREAVRELQRAALHDERNPVYQGELIRLYEAMGDDVAAQRIRRALASGVEP